MAQFNRINQGYQQRESTTHSNNQGWFPNSQELKRGETAPSEKGKREKIIGTNQQNTQLIQINAAAAASGFQLANTANLKEAIGKFKSSPYYSSVVNQQQQKKQQHNQQTNIQGQDNPKMSKQQHIQQISRIYQNNPTNILNSVSHNSNHLQNQSGNGTTTNKKGHGLDPYSSNNIPQRYSLKLPQRPSTSHDQQSVQRKQYQMQTTTQYRNTQMTITNTDGFLFQKPSTPVAANRVATAGQRPAKHLNNSGNFLLNTSLNNGSSLNNNGPSHNNNGGFLNNNGTCLTNKGNSQKGQQGNVLYPLQVRNTSVGSNSKNIKRRETFSTNNNNQNTSFNAFHNQEDVHKNQGDDLSPQYTTYSNKQGEYNSIKQKNDNLKNSQIMTHHADFQKDSSIKQNFFTHENFYNQGLNQHHKQEITENKSQISNKVQVIKSDKSELSTAKQQRQQSDKQQLQKQLQISSQSQKQYENEQKQKQLLKLSITRDENNNNQKIQQIYNNNSKDDASESNTPRIIVTGNQEQQSHKIQFIENSFTKYQDDEDETTAENKYHKMKSKNKSSNRNKTDQKKQINSHNQEEKEELGDDEHEDDQDDDDEDNDDQYHYYYNNEGEQYDGEDNDNYRTQYANPYDQDDDDDDYDDDEEDEDEQYDEEDGEGQEDYNHQSHQDYHHHQEHEEEDQEFYNNQHEQNRGEFSDDNHVQNFIQEDDEGIQQIDNDEEEDQFGESQIQKYIRDKLSNKKDQIKQTPKGIISRPMTTEGGKRRRGLETPVQNPIKQSEINNKEIKDFSLNQSQKVDNVDVPPLSGNRRQSQKENFNQSAAQIDSFNDEQFGQEFRIDFDTQQFERPPERGKQHIGTRAPVKVDHDLIKEDSIFKDPQGTGKRPPSRHRIPNRATGLGIPTQDLQDIPIKNMYDKEDGDDNINHSNKKYFESEKIQIEKIKQSQDSEDAFMNFDFLHFDQNTGRKASSRQPVASSKIHNERPQSGNLKSRALNKRESFDEGVNSHLPQKINQNNVQNLKLSNHPVSAKYSSKGSTSIHQKENDQLWDDFDDILNDKQAPKSTIRRLEGSDILIKHNVSSSLNNKKTNNTSQSVKLPFETSLGQDFLSLFANNFAQN